jgi:hypothetical protein
MFRATADSTEGQDLKKEVVETIDEFAQWFQGELKNEELSMPERAILDTYSYWLVKVRGKKEEAREASSSTQ